MKGMEQVLLQVDDLHVVFDGPRGSVKAVDGASLSLDRGETVAVVGESGSGKSVTARTVMGLSTPPGRITGGSVQLDGQELVGLSEQEWNRVRGSRVSMVFQDPMSSLNPTMRIGRQIEESIRLHTDQDRRSARARAVELLDAVRIAEPDRRAHEYPHQLSGGMRQRVMIALALSCGPDLLIADEPTTALDVTTQRQILELIGDLQRDLGAAVMLITHDIAVASNFSDAIFVMNAGRVVESAPTERLLGEPQVPYTRRLLGSVLSLDSPPHGTAHSDVPRSCESTGDDALLEIRDLKQQFTAKGPAGGVVRAVDGVSFTVKRGETLSIVGESGSGKSTTARAILQAPAPSSGQVIFEGSELSTLSGRALRAARADLQMVFQDPFSSLNPGWKVRNIVAEPMKVQGVESARERAARVEELLELVGLEPGRFADRTPRQVSGGQAQRVGIARALALRPKLVICDESVSSLDVTIQAQILDLFKKLGSELGLTYLFIAHDLAVVKHISDRVGVMYKGRLVEIGPCESVYNSPAHPYTVELLAAAPRIGQAEPTAAPVPDGAGPRASDTTPESRFARGCECPGGHATEGHSGMHEVGPDHFVDCHSTPAGRRSVPVAGRPLDA